jgi:hypothetical protein
VGLEFGKRDDQFKNFIRTIPKKKMEKKDMIEVLVILYTTCVIALYQSLVQFKILKARKTS